METKILVPNASSLMESTRAIGYSLPTAVADIVDNSIAAEATRIDINFSPVDEPYVYILDNGSGMNREELYLAMQYGGKSPFDIRSENDLGRFGLGLKTASLSQCEKLTVLTKKDNMIHGACWDLEYIKQHNEWRLLVLSKNEMKAIPGYSMLSEYTTGTLVVWENLDRMKQGDDLEDVMSEKMVGVNNHLALVFHRFLQKGNFNKFVSIYMNNDQIEPSDPFLSHLNTQNQAETRVERNVSIIPYVLPYPSNLKSLDRKKLGITENLRSNQGFYVYRNRRLIIWGTWFRKLAKNKLSELSRIQVDVSSELDGQWILDVKKSSATPPKSIFKELDAVVSKMANNSKRTWEHRGNKEIDDKIEHIWSRKITPEKSVIYSINDKHYYVKKILEKYPKANKEINALIRMISTTMPVNQMLLDFNDDGVTIDNSFEITEDDIREEVNEIIYKAPAGIRLGVLNSLKAIEPFNAFLHIIEQIESEIM